MRMSQKTTPSSIVSSQNSPRPCDPRVLSRIPELLDQKGFSPEAIEALLQFDVANFQWRRMWEREEFRGKVLKGLSDTLEAALLQGLISVARIQDGIGRPEPMAPTVGLVAEMMQVDPSRASRIVADLVSRGYVERSVAQDDARKSVLIVMPKGYGLLDEFMQSKWLLLIQTFDGWGDDDIMMFSKLFQRFASSLEHVVQQP